MDSLPFAAARQISSFACRPVTAKEARHSLFEKKFRQNDQELPISIRFLNTDRDIDLIHHWVNQDYAKPFWQLDGVTMQRLMEMYENILLCNYAQSFIGLLNDEPVCQLDLYHCMHDEISSHFDARPGDHGIHLLMAPVDKTSGNSDKPAINEPGLTKLPGYKKVPNLSFFVLHTFIEYFFQDPTIHRIIGEPDVNNIAANRLVKKVGFKFHRQIKLSYKTANLYLLDRNDFFNHPTP